MTNLTLCDPMDCSLLGSSVQGILQARILEWVATLSLGNLPNPGLNLCVMHWQAPKTGIQWMLPLPVVIAEELGECKKQNEQGNRIGPK